jgi:glycosyltransferase involved in cell wall biosynthesis
MARVLYISYDGLLDPLGASQILPYLKGIAEAQDGAVVLSVEKEERQAKDGASMAKELMLCNVLWRPLRFTAGQGAVSKGWDLLRLYVWGCCLAVRHRVRIVHTRGHPATQVGLFIKRLTGAQLIFDFRGLWVDERVDKGGWDLKRTHHRWQYHYFKRTERMLLANADQLVVLTEKVVPEVRRLGAAPSTGVTVIPCCADFKHFQLADSPGRARARSRLSIPLGARVLGYLGSVGRMYMLDRMFRLFELAAADCQSTRLLVVTQDVAALNTLMGECLPAALHGRVHVHPADREQVPHFIAAMDVLISFIQPSYARMAASPTKLAECFATGIPVICNDGVGDVAEQVHLLGAGLVVDPNSEAELSATAGCLDDVIRMGGGRLREAARNVLGLEVAAKRYKSVYAELQR